MQMLQLLRDAGYRITPERKAVVAAVIGRERPFSGADIVSEVTDSAPAAGRATVFRTLEVLAELGLIGRVDQPERARGYVLCPQGHHHHAICSRCGLVVDLLGCPLDSELETQARSDGFRLEGHRLEYYGTCRSCQEKGVS